MTRSAPDPIWESLLADSDVDDAFNAWQAANDRRREHGPEAAWPTPQVEKELER